MARLILRGESPFILYRESNNDYTKKIIDPYFIIDALKAYNVFLFSPNKVEDLIKYLYKYGYTTSRNFNVMGGSDHYTSAIAIQLGNSPVSPIETKSSFTIYVILKLFQDYCYIPFPETLEILELLNLFILLHQKFYS